MQKAVLVGALLLSTPVFADVPSVIAATVRREIGEQWVIPALKIAKIESGYNCKATGPATKHGRAKGVFQLMDGSARALGFSPRRMHDCNEGIRCAHRRRDGCMSPFGCRRLALQPEHDLQAQISACVNQKGGDMISP